MNPGAQSHASRATAFTLVELLVVLGVLALLAGVGWSAWRRPASPAREAALATLQSLFAAARTRAAMSGGDVALLVHADVNEPADYLRRVVVCTADGNNWSPVDRGVALPSGVFVLPDTALPTTGSGALRRTGETWTDADGGDLRSTALRSLPAGGAAVLGTAEWRYLRISSQGTTGGGVLLLGLAQRATVTAPVTLCFENPDAVCGLVVSHYGAVSVIRGRLER